MQKRCSRYGYMEERKKGETKQVKGERKNTRIWLLAEENRKGNKRNK